MQGEHQKAVPAGCAYELSGPRARFFRSHSKVASAAVVRALEDLVPLVEAALRRQGVTSKHFRLGREAALKDGTLDADLSMAALAHAVAIKDGLPVEMGVAIIAGILRAAPPVSLSEGRQHA